MESNEFKSPNVYETALIVVFTSILALAGWTAGLAQEQTGTPTLTPSSTYKNAVGVRAGGSSGLTFKHFTSRGNALEFILWGHKDAIAITGLYEIYVPAFDVPGLNWYYGGGGHVRAFSKSDSPDYWTPNSSEGVGLGVDGIVGLEYKIQPIPFAVSIDCKPYVEARTNGDFRWGIDPGIGIKFTF
ncbi:MAG: hypothetical protein RLP15_08240 [Cryomorphaceae bacterium]